MEERTNFASGCKTLIVCLLCTMLTIRILDSPPPIPTTVTTFTTTTTGRVTEVSTTTSDEEAAALGGGDVGVSMAAARMEEGSTSSTATDSVLKVYDDANIQPMAEALSRVFPKVSKEDWCMPGYFLTFAKNNIQPFRKDRRKLFRKLDSDDSQHDRKRQRRRYHSDVVDSQYHKRRRSKNGSFHHGSNTGSAHGETKLGSYAFRDGLLLTKVPKSASSVMAGVTLQLLYRNHCGQGHFNHQKGEYYKHRHGGSFLFSSIRDPASRAISFLNFRAVSIDKMVPTEENVLYALQHYKNSHGSFSDGKGGFALQYLSMSKIEYKSAWRPQAPNVVLNPANVQENVKRLLQDYDFLVVVDRMDESMVALSLILGVDVADVVTVQPSKVAGMSFYEAKDCLPLKSDIHATGKIAEFLDSDQWRAMNYGDYLLHAAANYSLDKTIASFDKDEYDTAFTRYKKLKALGEEKCVPRMKMPCVADGISRKKNDCFIKDFGCGFKCMDQMLNDLDSGRIT